MSSLISWLDHSEEDQRRVREMLQLFSDKGTVDDLGIGTVRDAISNALFPGTSVIQTRARYFLFVPWLFRLAERRHPQRVVAKATDMERSLIEALRAGGDLEGLIGRDIGPSVRTLPSTIFWGGLIRYGIFLAGSLSIRQYGRQVAGGLATVDTEDEVADRSPSFWQRELPDPPLDLFQFRVATFDLTREEAEWLCERVISSGRADDGASLLTVYVRSLRRGQPPPAGGTLWDAGFPADTLDSIARLVHHAERFSCAIQGAALLYNLMLAEQRTETLESGESTSVATYRRLLDEWTGIATRVRLADWATRFSEFWTCIPNGGLLVPQATRQFLNELATVLATDLGHLASSGPARDAIRRRELKHKRYQARFANQKRLAEWSGYSGTGALVYRWPQVQRMLRDIAAGLGTPDGGAAPARP